MSAAPSVSILIASERDPQRLARCFAALARGVGAVDYEIVVLVNGGDEALRAFARRDHPRMHFVLAEANLGFAGAVNGARRHASGELLAIVHDDCLVCEGWLAPLLDGLERHPEAGLIASRIEVPDGGSFCGTVVFSDASFAIVPTAIAGAGLPTDSHTAASLMRAEAFDGAGGCDERLFPAGVVDADLAMRMREAGWDVRCEPASGAEHALGHNASTGWRAWTAKRNV
ncbi:MAG: glycosyltransferase family 2 protein [Solirubrobacteraceae bacterium]